MDSILAGYEAYVAIGIILLLFVSFVLERYPPEVTAIAGAALFVLLGFVSPAETMEAFSNPAPITIAAMFVLSGALVRTGVLETLAGSVIGRASKRPILSIVIFLSATVAASAFMNNTPVVLILIPIVIRLAKSTGVASTRLLIPLSYAAVLGGTCTLIGTSTNLLVDGAAREAGLPAFSIFEITPVGLAASVSGLLTMLLLGPWLLPDRRDDDAASSAETEYLSEVAVRAEGKYTDAPISEIAAFNRPGLRIQGVRSGGEVSRANLSERVLNKGDTLIVVGTTSELLTLNEQADLRVGLRRGQDTVTDSVAVEAVVAPHRSSAGERIVDLSLGRRYGIRVLGAHRHRHVPGPDLENVRLRPADKLLLEGPAANFDALTEDADLVSVTRPSGRSFRRTKAPIAIVALAGVVLLAAAGVMDIGVLAMLAVAGILVLRCIDADEAWASIEGSVLILIFAMLIIAAGLENTGAVGLVVDAMARTLADFPPLATLVAVYVLSMVLTEVLSNNAVAVLITPVAIGLANQVGVDPRAFVVAVMIAASASFATPIGYQTNTLVYGAGNYRFTDFVKIGLPMNLIVGAASCFAIYLFFPMN